jgi:hypothetical protein
MLGGRGSIVAKPYMDVTDENERVEPASTRPPCVGGGYFSRGQHAGRCRRERVRHEVSRAELARLVIRSTKWMRHGCVEAPLIGYGNVGTKGWVRLHHSEGVTTSSPIP